MLFHERTEQVADSQVRFADCSRFTANSKPRMTSALRSDRKAIMYLFLLAIQFGMQPSLTRRFTPSGILRSTVLLVQEVIKFFIALLMLKLSGSAREATKGWTIQSWLSVAFIPAALYAVQNSCALVAYQNLDPLTFNVLNQTKTLSAALCCYLVIGRKQSKQQIFALVLLLLSALIMESVIKVDWLMGLQSHDSTNKNVSSEVSTEQKNHADLGMRHLTHGVVPILAASFISGLAGALSQKSLQSAGGGRNPFLFSMEICAVSSMVLVAGMFLSNDVEQIKRQGFWKGWTIETFIPIVMNSAGGIVVGLVTKYAGSVRKGFALIFGIFLSGLLQSFAQPDEKISREQVIGGVLAAVSLYIHAAYPPSLQKNVKQD